MELRLVELKDIRHYWAHLRRHSRESGRDDDLIFDPLEDGWDGQWHDLQRERAKAWSCNPGGPGWERCWVLCDRGEIFGELKLSHKPILKSNLHRAVLEMGIERPYRQLGWGSRLLDEAISWALTQPYLEWLDLFVFEHNFPARKLYNKFHFSDISRTIDSFRIHGQSITNIKMTRCLKPNLNKD